MPEPILLTAEEAGRVLGVGRTTIYRLMREGELTGVSIGASRRFPRDEITEYVAKLRERELLPTV